MATIKDIAARSGYSIATVSRALNDQRNVDPKIRKAILTCAEELNYKPNVIAQLLRTSSSNLILCVIPDINESLVLEAFSSMQKKLLDYGYQLLLYPSESEENSYKTITSMLNSGLVRGIIFISPFMKNNTLLDLNQNYPLVQLSEYNEEVKTATVTIDYTEAQKEVTDYLISMGHTQIAFLNFSEGLLSSEKKYIGFSLALAAAGIPMEDHFNVMLEQISQKTVSEAVQALFELQTPPTAIICTSDTIAFHCINSLQKLGVKVPDDCSIIGFDNSRLSALTTPALTTISSPLSLMGIRAADLLLTQIETGEKTNEKIVLPYELIKRDSVSQPRSK